MNAAGTAAVTSTYGYDNNGNQTSFAAPLSRSTSSSYDQLKRLTQVTDAQNGLTRFSYDANDNLLTVIDPRNLTTAYTYNGFGDVKTQTSPDTGLTTHTYDSAGNVLTSTDARASFVTYAYDALSRVTSAIYRNGATTDQTITYTYDAGTHGKGRLTSAADGNHSTSWTYDALGRVTGKGQTIGTLTQSIGYGYSNGRLSSLVTPSGRTVTYSYNANGQVTGINLNGAAILTNATYDPFGGIRGWTWGNGTSVSRSYDLDGRISQIATAGATKGYSYDDASRITGITDSANASQSWIHGYDALDRLTSASRTGDVQGFSYDANGNRLTQTGSAPWTLAVSPSSNRVTGTSGTATRAYGYDAAGNTTGYGNISFVYNNRNRLRQFTVGTTVSNYFYNAMGQRIRRTGGGGTVLYMYDEAGHLLGEYTSTGVMTQETIWLGDIPVATIRRTSTSHTVHYVHTDHLNTPRKVTNATNNQLRWSWESDPFGTYTALNRPAGAAAFNYNLRFPGQVYESQTGLSQNYFRDYDSAIGRYVESDPIGLQGGTNTYLYGEANPVSRIDPFGLQSTGSLECFKYPWCIELMYPTIPRATIDRIAKTAAAGAAMGVLREMCSESAEEREQRCQENLDRDLLTCAALGKRDGKSAYKICEQQAYLRYGNCLSGRDKGINAPLPPWGTK